MILVDAPVFLKPNGRKRYSHLASTDLAELHAFAERIGVKKHFFHRSASYLHYDITEEQQILAIANGARLVSSKDLVRQLRGVQDDSAKQES